MLTDQVLIAAAEFLEHDDRGAHALARMKVRGVLLSRGEVATLLRAALIERRMSPPPPPPADIGTYIGIS